MTKVIVIEFDKKDKMYAQQIVDCVEESMIIEPEKSFSSELNTVIQVCIQTIVPAVTSTVASIIVQAIKNKSKCKVKIANDGIEVSGFSEEKTLELVREYLKMKKDDEAQKLVKDMLDKDQS